MEHNEAVLRPAPHIGWKHMQHQQNTATAEGAQSHCGGGGAEATMTGYKSRDSGIKKADIKHRKETKGQVLRCCTPVDDFKK